MSEDQGARAETTREKPCSNCAGRGWVGTCTAGQFAYIGRMASEGRLPTQTCFRCEGTGYDKRA